MGMWYIDFTREAHFNWLAIIILSNINPRRALAARVTVVGLCVCVCVCVCVWCVRSNLAPHTLESQKRDTNGFIAIQEPF